MIMLGTFRILPLPSTRRRARPNCGHNKAPWTIRQDHPGGTAPSTGPAMQPNTAPIPHPTHPPDGAPVPAELLETVARALAAALIPPPRQPEPPAPDFLTAAQ